MDQPITGEIPDRVQISMAINNIAEAMSKVPKNSKPYKRLEKLLDELCSDEERTITGPPRSGDSGGSLDGPEYVRHRRGGVSSL